MTLVVGSSDENGPRLWADSRLSGPSVTPSYLAGALKPIIVNNATCVAYAGSHVDALSAVRATAPLFIDEPSEALSVLAHETACDFLVARLDPPELVRVRRGEVQRCADAWIGDAEAFGEFQEVRHTLPSLDPHLGEVIKIGQAMDHVVSGGRHAKVGELVLSVVPSGDGFMYADHAKASGGFGPVHPDGAAVMTFGDVERGDFTYTVLTPDSPGVGVLGAYFLEGRIGVLFHPLLQDEPVLYREVSQVDFAQRTHADYGIDIGGISFG